MSYEWFDIKAGPWTLYQWFLTFAALGSCGFVLAAQLSVSFAIVYDAGAPIFDFRATGRTLNYNLWAGISSLASRGTYALVVALVACSGIGPYIKGLSLLTAAHPRLLLGLRPITAAEWLYRLGKWSFVDVWFVGLAGVVVTLHQRTSIMYIDLDTHADRGVYLYFIAATLVHMLSMMHLRVERYRAAKLLASRDAVLSKTRRLSQTATTLKTMAARSAAAPTAVPVQEDDLEDGRSLDRGRATRSPAEEAADHYEECRSSSSSSAASSGCPDSSSSGFARAVATQGPPSTPQLETAPAAGASAGAAATAAAPESPSNALKRSLHSSRPPPLSRRPSLKESFEALTTHAQGSTAIAASAACSATTSPEISQTSRSALSDAAVEAMAGGGNASPGGAREGHGIETSELHGSGRLYLRLLSALKRNLVLIAAGSLLVSSALFFAGMAMHLFSITVVAQSAFYNDLKFSMLGIAHQAWDRHGTTTGIAAIFTVLVIAMSYVYHCLIVILLLTMAAVSYRPSFLERAGPETQGELGAGDDAVGNHGPDNTSMDQRSSASAAHLAPFDPTSADGDATISARSQPLLLPFAPLRPQSQYLDIHRLSLVGVYKEMSWPAYLLLRGNALATHIRRWACLDGYILAVVLLGLELPDILTEEESKLVAFELKSGPGLPMLIFSCFIDFVAAEWALNRMILPSAYLHYPPQSSVATRYLAKQAAETAERESAVAASTSSTTASIRSLQPPTGRQLRPREETRPSITASLMRRTVSEDDDTDTGGAESAMRASLRLPGALAAAAMGGEDPWSVGFDTSIASQSFVGPRSLPTSIPHMATVGVASNDGYRSKGSGAAETKTVGGGTSAAPAGTVSDAEADAAVSSSMLPVANQQAGSGHDRQRVFGDGDGGDDGYAV